MADWTRLAAVSALTPGSGNTFRAAGREIALFRREESWHALDSRCPHADAPLGRGMIEGEVVRCPLHGWRFDLATGRCPERTGVGVRVYAVRVEGDSLWIDLESVASPADPVESAPDPAASDSIHRYLVRYGRPGWIGLFGSVHPVAAEHRQCVLIRTTRGLEFGEVLADPPEVKRAAGDQTPTGEILRPIEPGELTRYQEQAGPLLDRLLPAAQVRLDQTGLGLDVVDGELLFDAEMAVLYFLGESSPDAGPLVTELAQEFGLARIELSPLIEPPAGGCGKPGCGGGGCHADDAHDH